MRQLETEKSLNKFGKFLVTESRKNLTRKKNTDLGNLYKSLDYNVKVSQNSFEFDFLMEDYGKFQDQGVKGKFSSQLAPNSPFQFGTGTGKKGGLKKAMLGWVTRKRFQFKDNKGKFMSYEQTASAVSAIIYRTGIKPTQFFSRPFDLGFKKLPEDVVKAYALDVETLFKFSLK